MKTSFLVPIKALKDYQINMLKNYIVSKNNWSMAHRQLDLEVYESDSWMIEANDKCVYGYTFTSNFDMEFFLKNVLKLQDKYIYWQEQHDLDLDRINIEILQEERKDKLDNLENVE